MKDKQLTNFLIEELLEKGKVIIYNFGTFELLPARKGKYYNMHRKEETEEGKRKWRVRFKMATGLKNKLK